MFDGGADTGAGEDLPYWGNVAFRSLRTVMPSFKMIQLGVHMVGGYRSGCDLTQELAAQHD